MRSFGVEEELLLVDERTGRPLAVASQLLDGDRAGSPGDPDGAGGTELTAELQQEMLEAVTSPQSSLEELREQIVRGRAEADRASARFGGRAVALATSPLAVHPHLMPHERYREMMQRYGTLTRDSLSCGCHVHVSVASDEEGVAVLDRIRPWLPVLAALSANSPFRGGEDTGYASYRTVAWRRWPTAGPYELHGSAASYARLVEDMLRTGVLVDAGMLYFDARLSRSHPTVEIRVADVCLEPSTTVAIAALCRGLVETAARERRTGADALQTSSAVLRLAAWRAAISGLEEELVCPVSGAPAPAREVVDRLLAHVEPALSEAGDAALVRAETDRLFAVGTGASWQRAEFARSGRLDEMIAAAVRLTQGASRPVRADSSRIRAIDSLAELAGLLDAGPPLYVRYSDGDEWAGAPSSTDVESGLELPGLSVNPLVPEPWWTRPVSQWLARQLCQYRHLRDADPGRGAWAVRGSLVGRRPDCEPLLVGAVPIGRLTEKALTEAECLYADTFDAGRGAPGS